MKKILFLLLGLYFAVLLPAQTGANLYNEILDRTEWWRQDRFGMFIHFGLYSIPARGEWVKSVEKIPDEQYQIYFEEFNPVDYNPREWAKLAKKAGMKYAVLTAKHHEGFALWDTKLSDYKSTNTPCKRDIVREFLDAFRAEGLKVGLYFSVIDWHHPDYPKYDDMHHPMRGNEKFKKDKIDWDNYLAFMHGQVKELVTDYGHLDIMWFDFSYGDMKAEKWEAEKLIKMVRSYQPGIILNNRLLGDGTIENDRRVSVYGDFETPEQGVPDACIKDVDNRFLPWETCLTLNNSWGYSRIDQNWKSPESIIHTLVNCVSKDGNLLLNVGPDARGNIPESSIKILNKVGEWMRLNGESVYGCGSASAFEKPEWGFITQKGNKIYLHWTYPKIGHINMKGLGGKVKKVRLLRDGSEIQTESNWWGDGGTENNFYVNLNKPTYQYFPLPDDMDTVFEIELK
ncbi:MAG: alpha-L-fucosidase [Bacteroidales bacterium]|nr:alpha-L-fucosidase [Bacteroidales bacterium]